MSRTVNDLACPAEVHDELKSDLHRVRTETVPRGVQHGLGPEDTLYLRNCKCGGTLAMTVDVDALSDV